jgi:methyltransferase (TIGR00027 family)
VTQYVILGAGLDTFAYRQPAWARELRIFEIDRPAMQEQKKERLSLSRVFVPDNVIFASIDFEREKLAGRLTKNGLDLGKPTFFSWLGVTMYLTEEAIFDVLRDVARFPKGSEIVFTFAPLPTGEGVIDEAQQRLAELAASVGEPWQTYFDPDDLAARLRAQGFSRVELIEPSEAAARYFSARNDNLPPPRRRSIVSAVV